LLRCCICDFVFVSFVHSCITRVAGLLSNLAVVRQNTRDYCLIVAAACLRAALHSTCVCRPVNYTYGQHWEHTQKPSQPTVGPDDRGLRNVSGFSTARANVQRRRVIPRARDFTSIRHADRSHYGRRYVAMCRSTESVRHVRYRVEGRTKR